jgi:leader peptidase (prepilin peptidase)/N-methyltransferase
MMMLMEQALIHTVLVVAGLALGSFAGATVWRLRARQLREDARLGEEVDKKEVRRLTPLRGTSLATDRSRCLHCGHVLRWYDLLPIASWLSTGGKCRYCKQSIGWFEPLIEIGLALFFVVSYVYWPLPLETTLQIMQFVLWLVAGILLAVLFSYDVKWYLLPNVIVFSLIGVGVIFAFISILDAPEPWATVISLLFSAAILSGLYFALWAFSRGAWIGFGDVKLGLGLALLLVEWPLAFIALFAANVIGCFIVLPGMMAGKITRKTKVPFGPLLIAGAVVAMLWGRDILGWYFIAFI